MLQCGSESILPFRVPESMPVCDLCGVEAVKVDRHRGTERCLLNELARDGIRPVASDDPNYRRVLKRKLVSSNFIPYLRCNIKMCQTSGPTTDFVPYDQFSNVAADIKQIADAHRSCGRAAGIHLPVKRGRDGDYSEEQLHKRARFLAAVNSATIFFTERSPGH